VAAPSAAIVSDADGVVAHYLREQRRSDIAVESLSAHGFDARGRDTWVIVQDEHLTFENQQLVAQLRARQAPWREIRIDGRTAAQVFHVEAR
jgi:predicted DCC family thiol-disulfide oxidoreductase YuxK